MSTTFVFYLKISFVVVATMIIDIVINKLNFVIINIYFIFVAIDTRCTTSKLKKTLKMKNKRSTESLNENCIY